MERRRQHIKQISLSSLCFRFGKGGRSAMRCQSKSAPISVFAAGEWEERSGTEYFLIHSPPLQRFPNFETRGKKRKRNVSFCSSVTGWRRCIFSFPVPAYIHTRTSHAGFCASFWKKKDSSFSLRVSFWPRADTKPPKEPSCAKMESGNHKKKDFDKF